MNMSTMAMGVMSGRAALFSTCCAAWPLYSLRSRAVVSSSRRAPGSSTFIITQAKRRGDRHVHEEQGEGATGERAELPELAELDDAVGERGEHQRDHDEEQHAQEDLPDADRARSSQASGRQSSTAGAAPPIRSVIAPAIAPITRPSRIRLASRVSISDMDEAFSLFFVMQRCSGSN